MKYIGFFTILFAALLSASGSVEKAPTVQHPNEGNSDRQNDTRSMSSYHVGLEYKNNTICQGAIISLYYVITAATCEVDNIDKLFVRTGSNWKGIAGNLYRVIQFITHINFRRNSIKDNNIALIRVQNPITINEYQWPIPMAYEDERIEHDKTATISVFREGGQLKRIIIPVVDKSVCGDVYNIITPDTFCTGYEINTLRACSKDLGAPVVIGHRLFGIMSYGKDCEFSKFPAYPAVHTEIAAFRNWIYSEVHF